MSGITSKTDHVPALRRWMFDSHLLVSTAGRWELQWADGLLLTIYKINGEWISNREAVFWDGEMRVTVHSPRLEIPRIHTKTRRELIEILTEWRRRDLAASTGEPGAR